MLCVQAENVILERCIPHLKVYCVEWKLFFAGGVIHSLIHQYLQMVYPFNTVSRQTLEAFTPGEDTDIKDV